MLSEGSEWPAEGVGGGGDGNVVGVVVSHPFRPEIGACICLRIFCRLQRNLHFVGRFAPLQIRGTIFGLRLKLCCTTTERNGKLRLPDTGCVIAVVCVDVLRGAVLRLAATTSWK